MSSMSHDPSEIILKCLINPDKFLGIFNKYKVHVEGSNRNLL